MTIFSLLIIACWALFLIVWLSSSFNVKRTVGGFSYFYAIRLLIILLVILVFHEEFTKKVTSLYLIQPNNTVLGIIGVILVALGIGFAIWARLNLGTNWGMPMEIKEKPDLITTGPYRYVRHPIYTGVITAILGSSLVSGPLWLVILFMSLIYFYYSAKKEEKQMMKEFPKTYPDYKKRTKMFIPFLL